MGAATIVSAERLELRISAKSLWIFLRVTCSDGITGHGEATMEGHEPEVRAALDRLIGLIADEPAAPERTRMRMLLSAIGPSPHGFTAISALDQALWDAQGQRQGTPVAALLAEHRAPVRLYANINRGIARRDPAGFAAAARKAATAGFTMIKIAPFDGLNWTGGKDPEGQPSYRAGLERIAAVRDAIGPDVALAVDCHWRFDASTAKALIHDTAPMAPHWIECPIAETVAAIPDLRRLRQRCHDTGTLLAGLESANGLEEFQGFITGGAYDVIMPDVKYAGGLGECLRIAEAAEAGGIACSPHNPTGPVCHAASLHLASALRNCPVLEHQFRETPAFDSIVTPAFPALAGGIAPLPAASGLGITLRLPQKA
ncbi:MAG: mandelate racemase/muconate lactonizing enzyme family protein [Tropicimonas sp.]|uniref:mandelate racemase/muconate lactonizing enzyme family protein n=1 Tax=Tropicimonas sp. TaxID=2067044 RepID=UPI003A8B8EF8